LKFEIHVAIEVEDPALDGIRRRLTERTTNYAIRDMNHLTNIEDPAPFDGFNQLTNQSIMTFYAKQTQSCPP